MNTDRISMIRKYTPADKLKLIDIFKLNIPSYFDPSELTDFTDFLEHDPDTYYTLEVEDTIIGGIGYSINEVDSSGSITWIFIHPDHAGKGYGRLAMDHCLKRLRSSPAIKTLIVKTSQHANEFFESFGYKLIKTEKDYWGVGLDLYLMEQAV